jgi:uncharacterized membrane protein YbhN (UPF0104 family)
MSSDKEGVAGRWRFVVASVAGLAAAVLLLRTTTLGEVVSGLAAVRPVDLTVAFVAYVLFVAAKSARFRALLALAPQRAMPLFGIVCAQTFWSNLLPLRAGDISYVVLLRRRATASGAEGVASLVVASLLDAWWMLVVAAAAGGYLRVQGTASTAVVTLTGVALGGIVAGVIAFGAAQRLSEHARRPAESALLRVPVVGRHLAALPATLARQSHAARLWRGMAYSSLATALRYGFQVYLLHRMFADVSPAQALFALACAGLVNMLPIQGVGNVGSVELPWTLALTAAGVRRATAVASGFALHGIVLVFAAAVGLLSVGVLRATRAQGAAR